MDVRRILMEFIYGCKKETFVVQCQKSIYIVLFILWDVISIHCIFSFNSFKGMRGAERITVSFMIVIDRVLALEYRLCIQFLIANS